MGRNTKGTLMRTPPHLPLTFGLRPLRTALASALCLAAVACGHAAPPAAPAGAPAPAEAAAAGEAAPAPALAAPAAPAATPDAVNFAVIGDFGVNEQSAREVAALVDSWQPDYVVTTGDNNYNDGAAETFDVNVAGHYGRYIQFSPRYAGRYDGPRSAQQRFFPSLGNHDWRTHGAKPYLDAFALPGHGRYYTVRRGPVALFVVDSDRHEPDGNTAKSKQAAWLRAALATEDAPHKLVVFHHPPYSVGPHGSSRWMRWPFAAWGATAVLSGHNHNYERHEVDGLVYVVNGIGGADLARVPHNCTIDGASASHCVGAIYGAMHVTGDAHELQVRTVTSAGNTIDHFVLHAGPGAH